MAGTIRVKEALAKMREREPSGEFVPFDLEWVAYDKTRKTGGKIMTAEKHVLSRLQHDTRKNLTVGITNPKNSHHPLTVHTKLILKFNGARVLI